MDTRHQKDAMSTDHKTRTQDEHLHEMEKRRLKESNEQDLELIPKPAEKAGDKKKE